MRIRTFFCTIIMGLSFAACSNPPTVEIVNNGSQMVKVTLYRKVNAVSAIPYDSSFLEKDYECRMTRLEVGKSLSLYSSTKNDKDSALSLEKLGFEKIQIETPQGHMTATRTLIPSLFCKHGSKYIMEVK